MMMVLIAMFDIHMTLYFFLLFFSMSCVRKGYNTFMAEHWKNISVFAELFRQIVLGRFDLRMYEGLGQVSTSPCTSN